MSKGNDLHSYAASVIRLGRGMVSRPRRRATEPEKWLELYEFEA
jgi:hypothetical protein